MPGMVNPYRRWCERSQADRGFDGEPPLHAAISDFAQRAGWLR
jgi:hypothetical protein